jgi:SAM-dependent methyltransferase
MNTSAENEHTNETTIDCYDRDAVHYSCRFLGLNTKNLCDKFLALLPDKAHILDLGCGPARDTKYFVDKGYKVTALDASKELVKIGREYTGHPILHMKFEDMNFRQEFDGIWSMASLLHLSREALIKVFENNLITALKPQGILYACFIEGEAERIKDGRYFHDYTQDNLKSILEQLNSFKILDIWTQEDSAQDRKGRSWVHFIVEKK